MCSNNKVQCPYKYTQKTKHQSSPRANGMVRAHRTPASSSASCCDVSVCGSVSSASIYTDGSLELLYQLLGSFLFIALKHSGSSRAEGTRTAGVHRAAGLPRAAVAARTGAVFAREAGADIPRAKTAACSDDCGRRRKNGS